MARVGNFYLKQMLYDIHVQEPAFSQIRDGVKKIEGRLSRSKFTEMKTGDELLLNETVKLKILNKTEHKTFREMISFFGFENVIPEAETLEEAEAVYFKYYSKEDEATFGVIALEIKVI
jgi:ASC-1-like (ASCH) protein